MRMLDASSIIHAWDEYPPEQFPGLWTWMAREISSGRLTICEVAFDEVGHKVSECAQWLEEAGIEKLRIDGKALAEAARIKNLLGIVGDNYHTGGVDENDLLIMAVAKERGACLVSNEAVQTSLPGNRARFKIPAVCALPSVSVECVNFSKYFKQSRKIF